MGGDYRHVGVAEIKEKQWQATRKNAGPAYAWIFTLPQSVPASCPGIQLVNFRLLPRREACCPNAQAEREQVNGDLKNARKIAWTPVLCGCVLPRRSTAKNSAACHSIMVSGGFLSSRSKLLALACLIGSSSQSHRRTRHQRRSYNSSRVASATTVMGVFRAFFACQCGHRSADPGNWATGSDSSSITSMVVDACLLRGRLSGPDPAHGCDRYSLMIYRTGAAASGYFDHKPAPASQPRRKHTPSGEIAMQISPELPASARSRDRACLPSSSPILRRRSPRRRCAGHLRNAFGRSGCPDSVHGAFCRLRVPRA